jgi:hypothetical protein
VVGLYASWIAPQLIDDDAGNTIFQDRKVKLNTLVQCGKMKLEALVITRARGFS